MFADYTGTEKVETATIKDHFEFVFVEMSGRVPGGGGEYSLIWTIWVCAAPKGMVFQPFWS